ncbi:hypothetical protein ABZ312_27275 [Streptomyces sp. NPDC006207]
MADSYGDSVSWMTIWSIRTPFAGRSETWPFFGLAGTKVQFTVGGHSVSATTAEDSLSLSTCEVAGLTAASASSLTLWPSSVVRATPFLMVAKTRSANAVAPCRTVDWL